MMIRELLLGACVLVAATASTGFGAPANLGLGTSTISPVIIGAQVPLNAFVYNTAAAGADDLNYKIFYTLPDGSKFSGNGTRAADGGASYDFWQKFYDTSNSPFGVNNALISVVDANALNSPAVQQLSVNVLNHAVPGVWVNGTLYTPEEPPGSAPGVDPLAFGATGGGESFAAGAPGVVGDPPLTIPTAELDLDSVVPHGDPEITITLAPFIDHVADDSPAAGVPWQIMVDASHAGTFTTFFDLGFSDEQDLLGADAPGSVKWEFEVQATVSQDLSTVTGNLIVLPEPATGLLFLPMGLVLMRRCNPLRRTT